MSLGEDGLGGGDDDDGAGDDGGPTLTASEKAAQRAEDLQTCFIDQVKALFASDMQWQSAMLVVGQYYSDNAYDEVHAIVVVAKESTPRWPHTCRYSYNDQRGEKQIGPREYCSNCTRGAFAPARFSWPYDERSFRAWEAYCSEGANQEQDVSEAYLPFAIARRREATSSELDVELIAAPVRAWLDAPDQTVLNDTTANQVDTEITRLLGLVYANPNDLAARHVLSDALLEKHDERGEYLAISLSKNPSNASRQWADAIEKKHEREWLGSLAHVVSTNAVIFENGFPTHVHAYFPLDHSLTWVSDAEEWATVQSLTFLPRGGQPVRPSMRHLRAIGPLRDSALSEFRDVVIQVWDLEYLHIAPDTAEGAVLLANGELPKRLPRLQTLVVSGAWAESFIGTASGLASITTSPFAERVHAIHIATGTGSGSGGERALESALLPSFFHGAARPAEIAFGPLGEMGEPAGFWIHFVRREAASLSGAIFDAHITVPRLGSRFTLVSLMRSIEALSPQHRAMFDHRIALRVSSFFSPVEADVLMFEEVGIRASIDDRPR